MKSNIVVIEILKGLPASGKSSYAKEEVAKSPSTVIRINKDDLRQMFFGSHFSKKNENFVLEMRDSAIRNAIKMGYSCIIVDDTNLHPKHEEQIRYISDSYSNVEVMINDSFCDVSVEECLSRDKKRENSVGYKIIMNMFNSFLKDRFRIEQDKSLPRAIICDVDGTLALHKNRTAFEYHKCLTDEPNKPVVELLESLQKTHPNYTTIILTGRENVEYSTTNVENLTSAWLERNGIEYDYLLIRGEGDHRKDSILKQEMFLDYIHRDYYVEYIIDDRKQVIDMWRSLGLNVIDVAGNIF